MAATDGQIVVAAARWADEGQYLRELVSKQRLPAVVKIIKGQYGGLGVPTLPAPGLQSAALLVSAGRRQKIAAQSVKLKEGRRLTPVGPRLAIPDTYPGYFELLSEEGRAVRCIEGAAELARRHSTCIVREPLRAVCARVDPDSGSVVAADGARTIAAGETLAPVGEVTLGKARYLRCTDGRGEAVLLSLEQRGGRFSALAREDNISGVHTARNLLASKRLPLTVRLVHGPTPRARHFAPEMRLLAAYEEEHVFALPLLHRDGAQTLLPLPLAAPLKLVRARNDDAIRGMREFQRLVERSTRLLADVSDRMQVLDGKLGDPKALRILSKSASAGHLLRRSASSDSANTHHHHSHSHSHSHSSHRDENRAPAGPPAALADDYDEIDQIYDYVRGFAPLPKSIRSPFADSSQQQQTPVTPATPEASPPVSPTSAPGHVSLSPPPPEPPPIETIPGKKFQQLQHSAAAPKAEKRTRRKDKESSAAAATTTPGLYIKHNQQSQRGGRQLLRQKSASPPLFSVRYKSLSNLQQAMELDGTLDSSHSGGRTSGDSGAGAKLPEKRSRRLSRPRSLTNLVWELRGVADTQPTPPPTQPTRKGSAHKLTVGGQKRIGTLYL